jgi:hypothetical protein
VSTTQSQSVAIGFPTAGGSIELGLNDNQVYAILWEPAYRCPGYRFDGVWEDGGTYQPATAVFSC